MTRLLPSVATTLTTLAVIVLSSARADATLLSDLMATHASIQQGNSRFSNIVAPPTFIGADPSNIDVQGITIGGQDGLSFVFVSNAIDPAFQFLASTVVGGTHERAIEVDFDATSINQQFVLHGITQSATGTTSQISPGVGYYLSDTQAFVPPNPATVLALSVTSPPQPFNPDGTNSGLLPADQSALHIWRQVQVLAGQVRGEGEGTAELTSFDVVFSQAPSAWTGMSSTNWADSGNWSGTVPGATTSVSNTGTALFNKNAPNSPSTIDAGRNVLNITFDTASVNSLNIGTIGGQALLMTAGGAIQISSTVVTAQTVNAPLVLEGPTGFTSDASSSSATLSFGGGITPGATGGLTTLTLNGGNTGANTISGVLADNGAGQLAATKSGTGVWILSGANSYSGGTTVSSGTLTATATGSIGSGPLIVSAADTITSTLNLGASQTVSSLSGTLAGSGSASVNIAAGTTLTVSQPGSTTFAGTQVNSGTLAKTDVGTLEFNGAPMLNNHSSLQVNGGTLRFNVNSGTATVGAGVTATVASGATLELAGSVSALSSGSNRVNIINNSQQASGGILLVSGTNQQVGAIDGTGDTVVNDGSDLMANHIIQNALVIGVTGSSPALVTIDASDTSGNPLGQLSGLALAGSLSSSGPFGADGITSANMSSGGSSELAFLSPNSSIGGGNPSAVPEPSTLLLMLVAVSSVVGRRIALRPRPHRTF